MSPMIFSIVRRLIRASSFFLLSLLLYMCVGRISYAYAYDCHNGATVEAADENMAQLRCNAFVRFKKRGEIAVDAAITDRVPGQMPVNREVRSYAFVVAVDKYPNFEEERDQDLSAVREDIPKIQAFLEEQNFDEIILLQNSAATTENIRYFLTKYLLGQAKIYKKRSRFLFAFDGHGGPGQLGTMGTLALSDSRGEGDDNEQHAYPLKYLQADLEAIAVQAFHTVALLGSCYSGGVFPIDPSHGQTSATFPKSPGAHAVTASGPVVHAWTDPYGNGTVFFDRFLNAVADVGKDDQVNEATQVLDGEGSTAALPDSIARLGLVVAKVNVALENVENPTTHEPYPQLSIGSIAPEQQFTGAFFFLGPRKSGASGIGPNTGSAVVGHPEEKVFKSIDRYQVRGVEISRYNGMEIQFDRLHQQVDFVYMKSTQGINSQYSAFARNFAAASAAKMPTGAYHFFDWCEPAVAQFENVRKTVPLDEKLLPFGVAVEWISDINGHSIAKCSDLNFMRANLHIFLSLIETYFRKTPIIYTATSFLRETPIIDDSFDRYSLWIADYSRSRVQGGSPLLPGKNPWTLWNYTNQGKIDSFGSKSSYDMSVFFGSKADFDNFSLGRGNIGLSTAIETLK